jgi:hypothetical protein
MKKPIKRKYVRRNPYDRALATAEKRLIKAVEEQSKCRTKLDDLNKEIPKLQEIIGVLGEKESSAKFSRISSTNGYSNQTNSTEVPKDIEKHLPPIDLTGIGSVPKSGKKITIEEENLPDPDGEPVLE